MLSLPDGASHNALAGNSARKMSSARPGRIPDKMPETIEIDTTGLMKGRMADSCASVDTAEMMVTASGARVSREQTRPRESCCAGVPCGCLASSHALGTM